MAKRKKSSTAVGKKWGGLRKTWIGYRIAHATGDRVRQEKYARIINNLQLDLGLRRTALRIRGKKLKKHPFYETGKKRAMKTHGRWR